MPSSTEAPTSRDLPQMSQMLVPGWLANVQFSHAHSAMVGGVLGYGLSGLWDLCSGVWLCSGVKPDPGNAGEERVWDDGRAGGVNELARVGEMTSARRVGVGQEFARLYMSARGVHTPPQLEGVDGFPFTSNSKKQGLVKKNTSRGGTGAWWETGSRIRTQTRHTLENMFTRSAHARPCRAEEGRGRTGRPIVRPRRLAPYVGYYNWFWSLIQ